MLEFHSLVDKYFETCRPTSAGSITHGSTEGYEALQRFNQAKAKASPLGPKLGCRGLWLTEASARRLVLGERNKTADAVLQFFANVEHSKGPARLTSSIVPVAERALVHAQEELEKSPFPRPWEHDTLFVGHSDGELIFGDDDEPGSKDKQGAPSGPIPDSPDAGPQLGVTREQGRSIAMSILSNALEGGVANPAVAAAAALNAAGGNAEVKAEEGGGDDEDEGEEEGDDDEDD